MKPLKKEQRQGIASLAKMKDSEIDLSEMPEVLDWSGAEVGRFYARKRRALTFERGERKSGFDRLGCSLARSARRGVALRQRGKTRTLKGAGCGTQLYGFAAGVLSWGWDCKAGA